MSYMKTFGQNKTYLQKSPVEKKQKQAAIHCVTCLPFLSKYQMPQRGKWMDRQFIFHHNKKQQSKQGKAVN